MLFCILGYFILENFNIIITIVVGIVGAIYIFVEFSIFFMFIEFTEEYLKIYDYKKKFLLKDICEQIEISKIKKIELYFTTNTINISNPGIIFLDEKKYKFDITNEMLECFALYMPKTRYILRSLDHTTEKQRSLLKKINVKILKE